MLAPGAVAFSAVPQRSGFFSSRRFIQCRQFRGMGLPCFEPMAENRHVSDHPVGIVRVRGHRPPRFAAHRSMAPGIDLPARSLKPPDSCSPTVDIFPIDLPRLTPGLIRRDRHTELKRAQEEALNEIRPGGNAFIRVTAAGAC